MRYKTLGNDGVMNKKKKPDLVVWSEERGYYQQSLPYGTNTGAPAISIENVQGWKQTQALEVNKLFSTKYDELKSQMINLLDEVRWNELVYSSVFNFTPLIGETYYLYEKDDGTTFLSLISPNEWAQKFIGATKVDSTKKWIKL